MFYLNHLLPKQMIEIIYRLPLTAYRLPLTAYRLPLTAYRLPLTAYRLPLTAYRFQSLLNCNSHNF